MIGFAVAAALLAIAAAAWLTRPLWRRGAADASNAAAGAMPAPPSRALAGGLVVFLVAVTGGGYAWLGAAQHLDVGPDSRTTARVETPGGDTAVDPNADTLSQAEARINAMVDRLAERLKTRPDDIDGWQMLGRSYAALGKHAQAIVAYETALKLRPDDATMLAELAFSAASTGQRAPSGEPSDLIDRALKLDPRNPKALALAGTLALERKDYAGAVRHWEALQRIEPADSPFGEQLRLSIAQARQLGGMPAAAGATSGAAATSSAAAIASESGAPAASATTAAGAKVGGTVTLSAALKDKVAPDATLFIYARAAEGPRMPLAVLRKQVKDLPLRFTLDDSLAMSPAAKLSGAAMVVVGARISTSGSAIAQPGDLQGASAAVPLGRDDLKIEIAEVVKAR